MFDTYAKIFAQRGNSYQLAMSTWPRARDAEFEAVLAPLKDQPLGLVCDMPAGGGYLAAYIHPQASYLAIEPSETFFAACASGGRCAKIQAALIAVPFPSGAVAYIVSLAGLHHEPDMAAVFREMRRLVNRDGFVVIADVGCGTAPARFLNGYVDAHSHQGHYGRFLDEATVGHLEKAGLHVLEDQMVRVPWSFQTRRDAAEYCRALFGLEGIEPVDVEFALASELGFTELGCRVELEWSLRRIVCSVGK